VSSQVLTGAVHGRHGRHGVAQCTAPCPTRTMSKPVVFIFLAPAAETGHTSHGAVGAVGAVGGYTQPNIGASQALSLEARLC
jgi:hypothetical protein